jgi:hypothetical protein
MATLDPSSDAFPSDVKGKVKSVDETVRAGTTALARLTSPRSPLWLAPPHAETVAARTG